MSCLPLRLLGCLLVLALAGCTTPFRLPQIGASESPPGDVGDVGDRDLNAVLAYYHSMDNQPARVIDQEREYYQAAVVDGRCDSARMRLGLVLLRAAELGMRFEGSEQVLRPCTVDPELIGSNVYYLADLIRAQLRSRTSQQSRHHGIAQEAEALKKENLELRRQVEGLKAIERSLQDRRRREQEGSIGPVR